MLLKNNSCKKQLFNLTIVDRSAKTTEIIDVREIKFFLIILKIMEKLYRKIQSKSSMTQERHIYITSVLFKLTASL